MKIEIYSVDLPDTFEDRIFATKSIIKQTINNCKKHITFTAVSKRERNKAVVIMTVHT